MGCGGVTWDKLRLQWTLPLLASVWRSRWLWGAIAVLLLRRMRLPGAFFAPFSIFAIGFAAIVAARLLGVDGAVGGGLSQAVYSLVCALSIFYAARCAECLSTNPVRTGGALLALLGCFSLLWIDLSRVSPASGSWRFAGSFLRLCACCDDGRQGDAPLVRFRAEAGRLAARPRASLCHFGGRAWVDAARMRASQVLATREVGALDIRAVCHLRRHDPHPCAEYIQEDRRSLQARAHFPCLGR